MKKRKIKKMGFLMVLISVTVFLSGISNAGNTRPPTFEVATPYIIDLGKLYSLVDQQILRINNKNQVVGCSPNIDRHGFLWNDGKIIEIGSLGGPGSVPFDINDRGQIVGNSRYSEWEHESRPFLITPRDVDNDGKLDWYYNYSNLPPNLGKNDLMEDLYPDCFQGTAHGINNIGTIVGDVNYEGVGGRAFIKIGQNTHYIPTQGLGFAYAVNDNNDVVGFYWPTETTNHAFFYKIGMPTPLDLGTLPGGTDSRAIDINNLGKVVGWSNTEPNNIYSKHAFIWDESRGLRDLQNLFPPCPWKNITNAIGINNNNHVVGVGFYLNIKSAFLWEEGSMFYGGTIYNLNDIVRLGQYWDHLVAASDINDKGNIVGCGDFIVNPGEREPHGFLIIRK